MTTQTVRTHWFFPGWRALGLACVAGVLSVLLACVVNWPLLQFQALPPLPRSAWLSMPAWVFVEEWVFRGQIFRSLYVVIGEGWIYRGPPRVLSRVGLAVALIVSSALFSLAHGMLGAGGRFTAGLVLGLVYWRTRSLWASMATHLTHDLLALGLWLAGLQFLSPR